MARGDTVDLLSGEIIEESRELSLLDLCRVCGLPAEQVLELVEQGIIEPHGREPSGWRFHGICVRRVHRAVRLEQDLGVNAAGAALAVELLEELERLRARLRRLEP